MADHDVVYANLAGDLERQARSIVKAMDETGVRRLIFISSMGIYDEVPGEKLGSVLDPYRESASVIEASDLDYTILRPAWITDADEIDYETTQKGEPFKGSVVSRKCVAPPGRQTCRVSGVGGSSQPGREQTRVAGLTHGKVVQMNSRGDAPPMVPPMESDPIARTQWSLTPLNLEFGGDERDVL